MMKHKKHQLTAQELYRARKQREEEEKDASLPPGLINHGNTCFMNSTLQGLMATQLLHNLVNFEPIPESLQHTLGTSILARRSPQLTNGHGLGGKDEHPWVEGMPLGDVFIDVMRRAWSMQESRKRESMSPKELLFAIGHKYDQYMGYQQQDAHEFLRHILDAMRMEELDIIKKRQPPPPKEPRKRSGKKRTPAPSTSNSSTAGRSSTSTLPESEQLRSFVDMLFGGQLASILVCEKCKKVSLTYEDFNDLSLSIKPEDYVKDRKRYRFRQFARKFRTPFKQMDERPGQRSSSVPADPLRRSLDKGAQEDEPPTNEGPRRRSIDHVGEEDEEDEATDAVGQQSPVAEEGGANPANSDDRNEENAELKAEAKERPEIEPMKEKKDKDPWGEFGRRLSVSVKKSMKALDPNNSSRSVERGRKVQAKDKKAARHSKREEPMQRRISSPVPVRNDSSSDLSDVADAAKPRLQSSSPVPSPLGQTSVTADTIRPPRPHHKPRPTIVGKRKKSIPAPKPSAEQAAYLRRLLADVHAPNGNPLAVLQHAIAGNTHHGVHVSPSIPAAMQAAWTKMGHLPGIEECLRMFTAVEVLDGENMVGCHRCWKIANGLYKPPRSHVADKQGEDNAANEEEEEEESDEKLEDNQVTADTGSPPLSGSTETLSSSDGRYITAHITPMSASVPQSTVSLSEQQSDANSVFSAPSTVGSPMASDPALGASGSDKGNGMVKLVSATLPKTYGGFPIPSISTTGPESPVRTAESSTMVDPSSKAAGASLSDDLLLAPRRGRSVKGPEVEYDANGEASDDSYESDSDISVNTSVYSDASSIAPPTASPSSSRRASLEGLRKPVVRPAEGMIASPVTKVARSKQVIMRRMYKRYLIAVPPPILVVHLKRFQQTSKTYAVSFTGGVKKLDEFVAFPEYLDLIPFLAPRREDFRKDSSDKAHAKESNKESHTCMYRLYAVVVHIGNMLGGHYVAYTALPPTPTSNAASDQSFTSESFTSASITQEAPHVHTIEHGIKSHKSPPRQWAYISDTIVRLTTIEEVLKAKAYICMYERI